MPPNTLSNLQQKLLIKRGIISEVDQKAFLSPQYEALHDPFLLPDMEKAVERILRAMKNNERIVIYSDYDADGIPGGVILHDFFKKVGYTHFENYIPHRHDEGFGLNEDAIDGFIASGTKVLITVDCGITDVHEVKRAADAGIDVIITDHHIPHDGLPPAYAIVNPKMPGSKYPFDMLCGAALGWKLAQALVQKGKWDLPIGWEKWLLDMVGIATISDMVPLTGENRVLAHYGLKVLRKSGRPGLMKLLSKIKVNQKTITEDDIGFMITPRINAASRMGHPIDAFHMLSSTDIADATARVEYLITINDERKRLTASLSKHVESILNKKESVPSVIVAGHSDWKPGILGLVANSIAESYNRPVFLWGREGGLLIKGSVRSGGVCDIVALMKKVEHLFTDYGGHAASGGFSIAHDRVDMLDQALNDAFGSIASTVVIKEHDIDADIVPADISESLMKQIEPLAPFGLSNKKPLFRMRDIRPHAVRQFGKGNAHLEVTFSTSPLRKAIAFFKTPEQFPALARASCDLIGHVERSFWNGRGEIRVRIIDIV